MKTLLVLVVVCLSGVALAKPVETDDQSLVRMLKDLLTKGDNPIVTKKDGKGKGSGSEEAGGVAGHGEASGEAGEGDIESTMLYGLPIGEFVRPKKLTEEELKWIQSAVEGKDLEDLKGVLVKVAADMTDIAVGFVSTFKDSPITDIKEVKTALEKFNTDVVQPKDLDMEGLKEWVEGLIIRAVISGTKIQELDDVEGKNYNEKKCKKGSLGCILGKLKIMQIAIETRQMMTMGALYDERFGTPLAFCDSVFKLAERAATDPSVITGENIVRALSALGQCFIDNGVKIEARLNPDAADENGNAIVPNLPIPRLLALNAKMEVYEFQGWAGYMSFMVLEHIFQAMENGAEPAVLPAVPAKRELLDDLKELLADIQSKSERKSRF